MADALKLKIEYLKPESLIPYANNPRHNDDAVEYVARSIQEFGFKVPIVIDKNRTVVTGHTRLKAALKLGLEKVPVIRANDLTDDQIKAFRIADNKVSEFATWDLEKLEVELNDIELDMGQFDLHLEDFEPPEEEDDGGWYGDERERTNKAYNLDLVDPETLTDDFWQMPIIRRGDYIPDDLVGFNYAKTNADKGVGIHFYVDDYQFERVWNAPEKYVDILRQYDCILSPDFSLYMDMPMAMKIWNTYRSRFIGRYYQDQGIRVIPTVSWAEPETYEFCFRGIETGSVVSISTVGVKEDKDALAVWRDGTRAMIEAIKPKAILVYGGKLDFDYGNIEVHYFENKVTENWN